MRMPIQLILNDNRLNNNVVGHIHSYGYETPWMTGTVELTDQSLWRRLVAVSSMNTFSIELDDLELDDATEDRLCDEKLRSLGITWQDIQHVRELSWSVCSDDGDPHPIYSPRFYESGLMEWRL